MEPRLRLSVEEYLAEVLALVERLAAEPMALRDAEGRTLASPVTASGPVPAFANSAMDGFAVRHADLTTGVVLAVVADVPAGSGADPALRPGECARIMTGAPLPTDADTVVPLELTSPDAAGVRIDEVPRSGAHVRGAGEDLAAGDVVLSAGAVLEPRALSLAAAAGRPVVEVVRRPVVAVAATGDELTPPGTALGRGQIHASNSFFLAAAARRDGAEVRPAVALPDDPDAFVAGLDHLAGDADLVVLSGGVSVGDYDVVRIVLARGEAAFRHVGMQPGKPQGWARWRTASGRVVPVIALPGNPLSTQVSHELFVRPVLERLLGRPARPWATAVVAEGWRSPAGRRQFIPVVLGSDEAGRRTVRPAHRRGSASHMVSALAHADALAEVAADTTEVAPGDLVAVRRLA